MIKNRLVFALVACIAAATSEARAQSPVPSAAPAGTAAPSLSALLVPPPIPPGLVPAPPANSPAPVVVPPPLAAVPPLPAPPLRPVITPRRDPALIQRLTPRVEVWRSTGDRPQIPVRRNERGNMDPALVMGTEPVTIRLQFDARSAGEHVTVIATRGILPDPPHQVLTISAQGDCAFAAQLSAGAPRGHLITYCKNVRTVVPLQRAPLAAVQAWETQSGGRP